MAPEKKNDFLDVEDSDDDQSQGYDSEAEELQKGGRSAKRRRVDDSGAEDVDDNSEDEAADHEDIEAEAQSADEAPKPTDKPADKLSKSTKKELPDGSKTLSKKNLIASEAAVRKSGVVYLSRIPPYMKPHKLRTLLQPHGTLNRIFLAPEDPAAHTRRVKAGGNKKRLFTEGWVEFTSKKDAKRACEMLNARPIGGKKGSYYRDDIWNLIYLKGFKWHNLTEQISSENAERASRMRAEIARTTKENKEFVRNVERSKVMDTKRAKEEAKKKRKRDDGQDNGTAAGGGDAAAAPAAKSEGKGLKSGGGGGGMTFKQVPLAKREKKGQDEQPEHVTRVLSKIF